MFSKHLATACALGALLAAAPLAAQTTNGQATSAPATGQAAPATAQTLDSLPPAPAGTDGATMQTAGASELELEGGFIARQGENQLLGSDLMDASVVTMADESLGSVEDVVIDSDGRIRGIVVGVGGFLGIGEKQVAIPLDAVDVRFEADMQADAAAGLDADTAVVPQGGMAATQPAPGTATQAERTDMAAAEVEMDETRRMTGESGSGLAVSGGGEIEHIVVDFTREQLEAAPEFATLDEWRTQSEATGSMPATTGEPALGTPGATPVPAPGATDAPADPAAQPRQ
ncbi:PRC-barrel domain-containing protein [Salinarimonas rosea]|uniref:PRC-barrel domain-containing protein n=1 Tax=Salinarimonas rosea TaxID=552063 RepID=UPI000422D995|nr:PRC-barrel domain-containing protein [Salinarimonas rosea]